jgi:hypothetical protein
MGPRSSTALLAVATLVAWAAPATAAPAARTVAGPAPYAVPAHAVHVANAGQLVRVLAERAPRDVVLADGVYDNSTFFFNPNGHRLYAQHVGRAVFHAGLVIGGNWGPGHALVRGLSFDVSNRAKTISGEVVHVWGTGTDTRILDTTFEGHGRLGAAIAVRQPNGFVASRIRARHFTDAGITVDSGRGNVVVRRRPLLEDVDVAGVSRPVPRSANGTAEACLWLGETVTLRRARLRDCAWMGIWTGRANRDSLLADVDVDATPVGVYVEHFTTGATFQRIHVRRNVEVGITCEWANPAYGRRPACDSDVIEDSLFEASRVGVYLDEGTLRTIIRRCTFRGSSWAGIGDFRGVGNIYARQGNDFRGLPGGAVATSNAHV